MSKRDQTMDSYTELTPWMLDAIAALGLREKQVLRGLDAGRLQKDIARELGISAARVSAIKMNLRRHFGFYQARARRSPFLYE